MIAVPCWNRSALLRSPFFSALSPALAELEDGAFPDLEACNAMLQRAEPPIVTASGHAVRLVPQQPGKCEDWREQYEPRCYLKGEVETRRDNWHDLLNALVWRVFPRAKAAINARHYAEIAASPREETRTRGAVRDMLTLFDESGVIVPYADAALAELLRGFAWKELFWRQRETLLQRMGFYLFGHGLHEKALAPYPGMTGQGLLLPVPETFFDRSLPERLAELDVLLAGYLGDVRHCQGPRELTPVPLLGVPGWVAENADERYYEDTRQFRPARRA